MPNPESLGYALSLGYEHPKHDWSVMGNIIAQDIAKSEAEKKRKDEQEKKQRELDAKWQNIEVDYSKYYGPIANEVSDESKKLLEDIYKMREQNPYGYGNTREYKDRVNQFKIFAGSRELESNLIKTEAQLASANIDDYDINLPIDEVLQSNDYNEYRKRLSEMGQTHFTPGTYATKKGLDVPKALDALKPSVSEIQTPTKDGGSITQKIFNIEENKEEAETRAKSPSDRLAIAIRKEKAIEYPLATEDEIIEMTKNEIYAGLKRNFNGLYKKKEGKKESSGGLQINVSGGAQDESYKYTLIKELSKDAATLKALMAVAGNDVDINDETNVISITNHKDKIMQVAEVPIGGVMLKFRPSRYVWGLDKKDGTAKWFVEGTQEEEADKRGNIKNKKKNTLLPYEEISGYINFLASPDEIVNIYKTPVSGGKKTSSETKNDDNQQKSEGKKRKVNPSEYGGTEDNKNNGGRKKL